MSLKPLAMALGLAYELKNRNYNKHQHIDLYPEHQNLNLNH
nr:hypothetical protein Q903MT_gene758 [Picea sitchensis]